MKITDIEHLPEDVQPMIIGMFQLCITARKLGIDEKLFMQFALGS